ncbi:MAG TPA: hypothetical protein VGF99_06760 [Myxococcota bacterium]
MNTTSTTRPLHVHGRRFAAVAPLVDGVVVDVADVGGGIAVEAVVAPAPVASTSRPRHVHGPRFAEVAPLAPVIEVVVDAAVDADVDVAQGTVEADADAVDDDAVVGLAGVDMGEHQLDDDVAITASGAMVRVALHVRSGARVVLVTVDGLSWHRVATVPVDAGDDEALLVVEETVQAGIAVLQAGQMPVASAAFVVAGLLEAARSDDVGGLWDRWRAVSSDVFRAPTLVPLRRIALAV